jgi:ribonucleoside-diphosphate reductase beta chain
MQSVNIFNANKSLTEYREKQPLFFGPKPGLFDTVNKHYPDLWDIYKEMKSLDWDENEFDYSQCNVDFKTCPKSVYDMMIRTLAWQWEADSTASRSVLPLMAPFVTDTALWTAWQRISDNESVHAATYSEIVRMSFDDPTEVMQAVLEVKESLARLDGVKKIFDDLYLVSHQYALGLVSEDVAYDAVFMTVCALLVLERIQFTGSFSITFTICATNVFLAIGKAVQKIAQDELEVHVKFDKSVLNHLMATQRGRDAMERLKPRIKKLVDEVVASEFSWTDNLFSEGRSLVGTNAQIVKNFILFNAKDVYTFFGIKSDHKFPAKNPMPHVDEWINIGNTQSAPQEQDNNQYKVGVVIRDDANQSFDVDF